ncbi:MAG: hypothetical protein ACKV2O_08580 [Acidimicrobiales bacterium]
MPLPDSCVPPFSPVSLLFADAIRLVGRWCRQGGWVLPDYRSPPAVPGVTRTVRRRADGSVVIAVLLHGRPWEEVTVNLIEGVVVANNLRGDAAARCRSQLHMALGHDGEAPIAA